jgi:3-oxoacyl-[acyl-carrier-protein] synthase II
MIGNSRRVVVTGLGVVTSLGHDVDRVFDALCRGETGIRPIRRFDASDCPSKVAGIIEDLDASAIIRDRAGQRCLRSADWIQTMALCAAELAARDAGLGTGIVQPERLGVFMGTGRGGAETIRVLSANLFGMLEPGYRPGVDLALEDRLAEKTVLSVNPVAFLQQCQCLVSAYLSMRYQARGPTLTNVNLCSAGAQAIGEAAWVIARDDADVMFAGGADSMVNPVELTAFCALDAVSRNTEAGPAASRPFDLRRDGCVVGEGAAVLMIEERVHAERRGARIYAELLGYGASSDAYKVSAPPEDGAGAVLAMRRALVHAGLPPEAVDHVNAHGTSTPLNDRIETLAIRTVFGPHAYRMPVVSTKSMTGHLIAAAGALEAAITIKCLDEKRIPPTRNLEVPDPQCDLDYASEGSRNLRDLRVALSNSFAIGGSNACLVFGDPT